MTAIASSIAAVHVNPADNVAIATRPLAQGELLQAGPFSVTLTGPVKMGHKIALVGLKKGERVIRYGQTIGFATTDIAPGDWIHSHNLAAQVFAREYDYATDIPADPTPITDRTFQGYRRADGRAGTRNYLAVLSSVNCSAHVAKLISRRIEETVLKQFPNVDGVIPIMHKGGCAMQFGGEDHQQLVRTMAGFAKHPNIGGYLIVGLGCETGSIPYLVDHGGLVQISGLGQSQQ
jgi:altronate hydrolase